MDEPEDPFELTRPAATQIGSPDPVTASVRAISDLLTIVTLIGIDFCDVRTVLDGGGRAVCGVGEAEGPNRAIRAAEAALVDVKRAICAQG